MGKKSSGGASDKKKKNKGPKGKRARAKAKLERQWGEEAITDTPNKRSGKSRLLARHSKKVNENALTVQHPTTTATTTSSSHDREEIVFNEKFENIDTSDSEDSDSSSSDQDENDNIAMKGQGIFFSKLLKDIRKTKHKRHRSKNDESDGSSSSDRDEEDENGSRIREEEEEMSSDATAEASDDDENNNDDCRVDFFAQRFCNTDPLPEDDKMRDKILASLETIAKVGLPHVDSMLELHVSKPLLTDMGIVTDTGTRTTTITPSKKVWKKFGKQSIASNCDLMKRRWDEVVGGQSKLSALQRALYPFMARYADCLISHKSRLHCEQASNLVLLHIVNHVLTSRERIQQNNRRIKKMSEEDNAAADDEQQAMDDDDNEEVFKDQGYTRPTILVLLPTRGTCYAFIKGMVHLLDGSVPQEYADKFEAEFGPPPNVGEDGAKNDDDDALKQRRKKVQKEKGAAWQELFGDDVNDDDDFKIGLALDSKSSKQSGKKKKKWEKITSASSDINVKLFTGFNSSDIIVASPLALRMALSSDTDDGNSDFLSSIEICLVDRADVLMMQNWDHVNEALEKVNRLPRSNNETDFSRVRNYFLVEQAAHWRQLIVFSDILEPAIRSSFKRHAKSRSGVVKTRQREDEGSIAKVLVPIRQAFQRIPSKSFTTMSDDKLKYLTQTILPPILHKREKHTIIFIPSYIDFVSIRNYLMKNEIDFVNITEYSRVSETSRGRARFLQGLKPLMLYTGRAHFFLRHSIKGIRKLIFFGLPEHPDFYADLVNVINEGLEDGDADSSSDATATSIALFTKYDAHSLERIVGTKQSQRMLKGEKSTFMFFS